MSDQGRRRVLKSGPAEEIIEWRRHQRGESTRGGPPPPLVRGVRGSPLRKNRFFSASMCVFNGFLCVWDQISVTIFLLEKIFLGA